MMKRYAVWMEGYATNGERAGAEYVGSVIACNFQQAALLACKEKYGEKQTMTYFSVRGGVPCFWGCRMFDNQADAMRAFG